MEETKVDAIKSLDSRTIWELHPDGRLKESGNFGTLIRDAVDTEILLTLLKRNEKTIHSGADKERTKLYGNEFKGTIA